MYGSPCSEIAHKYLHTKFEEKTVKHKEFVNMTESKSVNEFLQDRFKKGEKEDLVEMLIAIVDEYGFISDCALVEAAKFAGVNPVAALSTASSYPYFPLEKVGENVVYVCQCENC